MLAHPEGVRDDGRERAAPWSAAAQAAQDPSCQDGTRVYQAGRLLKLRGVQLVGQEGDGRGQAGDGGFGDVELGRLGLELGLEGVMVCLGNGVGHVEEEEEELKLQQPSLPIS